ncbi:WhiB family transcriptional regulator [Streptomyces sp. NPDC002994]|uniref:WhiB family transcriptional regulator n=1 Tax=Streptomyces sp. NPDC002994 TaxID=3154441 RepID=UPI0033AC3428
MTPRTDWLTEAACAQTDPELFFHEGNERLTEAAIAVCNTCPVQRECLIDAIADEGGKGKESRYGIRAGLTPGQRYWKRAGAVRAARKEAAA